MASHEVASPAVLGDSNHGLVMQLEHRVTSVPKLRGWGGWEGGLLKTSSKHDFMQVELKAESEVSAAMWSE